MVKAHSCRKRNRHRRIMKGGKQYDEKGICAVHGRSNDGLQACDGGNEH